MLGRNVRLTTLAGLAALVVLAGCTWLAPKIQCADESGWRPRPTISCDEAINGAMAALPAEHAPIDEIIFVWGACPPSQHCGAMLGSEGISEGIVTFHFRDAPDGYIAVSKQGGSARAVSELTPLD